MTCGIYYISCTDGNTYVGQSTDIERRISEHNLYLNIDSYEVLEECDKEYLNTCEWEWCMKIQPSLNTLVPILRGSQRGWVNKKSRDKNPNPIKVAVTVPETLLEQFKTYCEKERRSVSAQITLLMEELLKNQPK